MRILLRSYKTEINPTLEQIQKINQFIGTCRFVYNFYLSHNKEVYEKEKKFISGMDFSKWINNVFIKENPEYLWIKEASSKAVKQSIMNAERAYKRFFKGQSKFPQFKKKGRSDVKIYFVKTDAKTIIPCERHRIKIPTLGWVRLKENGYFPTNQNTHTIKSGTVSMKAGRYYVSILVETKEENIVNSLNNIGIGIDLGLKDFAICSNGITYKNINKTVKIKKLEKQLKREQRCLSRKYEDYKKRLKKGEATRQNIQKQIAKVQKLHQRINNIRTDYINKSVSEIVKTKPSHITIEDLNISGMMKNRHLSKAVASQKFHDFRRKLEAKCKEKGIELRIVDRWYPSSKLCHECGYIKTDLKLSDREYICECGYHIDRDFNASLNLRDAKIYKIAS
ncbi:transposase [Anaerocolumna aminovalerica]|uniref:RNA-guided endonuclease InsQ/TnpB family protein n=1 Tax=Anaerocolumna aminovalerica TaxID=1527 RepID=UPI001C0F2562|nr:RNA-guided endonuclease TnpB family protein [Anaerocolumna aminovalerica]MBU5332086.1 transposase [Anaerocolumna aminovalerica]